MCERKKLLHDLKGSMKITDSIIGKILKELAENPSVPHIEKYIHHMRNMVNLQLDLTERMDDLEESDPNTGFKKINPALIAKDIATSFLPIFGDKHITCDVHDYTNGAEINGLQFELKRAFINAIHNAIDAMDLCEDKTIDIFIDLSDDEKKVKIMIQDTGPGFSQEALNLVLKKERYYTTKSGYGHGIGMQTIKDSVELHNGTLTIQNRTDKSGAKLIIEIPR